MEEERIKICPYCAETVNPGALYCKSCARLLEGDRPCPWCREPIPTEALRCRYCGSDVTGKRTLNGSLSSSSPLPDLDATITASPIGAFLSQLGFTALLYPPEMRVTREQILIRRWTLFGLRVYDQTISPRKIASVRFQKGIIWASIVLETHGGSISDIAIPGLDSSEAQKMVLTIKELVRSYEGYTDAEV